MNKKGFTLVELIAVMILLGVLGLIATVTISNELKENKESLYQTQLKNIEEAAKTWADQNVFSLPTEDGGTVVITLGQLKQAGLIGNTINPKTGEAFSDSLQITITLTGNTYTYTVTE